MENLEKLVGMRFKDLEELKNYMINNLEVDVKQ